MAENGLPNDMKHGADMITTLPTDDLLVVLRALYWYEDKLANTDIKYQDGAEWERVNWLRTQLGNRLKFEARID